MYPKTKSDWRIKSPCRLGLVGPSESGKSTLIAKLLEDDSVWQDPPKKIIYCSPSMYSREAFVTNLQEVCGKKNRKIIFVEEMPDLVEIQAFGKGEQTFLILDDMLGFRDLEKLTNFFLIHSHHSNISIAYAVQNIFFKNPKLDMQTIVRNSTGMFLFYQGSDLQMYSRYIGKPFPGAAKKVVEFLEKAKHFYGLRYVFINIHPSCDIPQRYKCYTALFKNECENFGGSPIFFDAGV